MSATRQKNKKTLRGYADYLRRIKLDDFLPEIKEDGELSVFLSEIKGIVPPTFMLEYVKFELRLNDQSSDLKTIFNHIVPDETIPYVFYTQEDEFFAKIYEKTVFYEDWLEREEKPSKRKPSKEEVFFRLQSNKENFICWNSEKITFSFQLSKITTSDINRIIGKFKTELIKCIRNTKLKGQLTECVPQIVSLGGQFTIPVTLEPEIFAAYVTNDPIAQKFLFFDEYQKDTPF